MSLCVARLTDNNGGVGAVWTNCGLGKGVGVASYWTRAGKLASKPSRLGFICLLAQCSSENETRVSVAGRLLSLVPFMCPAILGLQALAAPGRRSGGTWHLTDRRTADGWGVKWKMPDLQADVQAAARPMGSWRRSWRKKRPTGSWQAARHTHGRQAARPLPS